MACIWYVSKYVTPPATGSAGGRGFMLMRELCRLGHRAVVITSDSNQLATVPAFDGQQLRQVIDGVEVHWLKTMKYRVAKSKRRVLSWLHFEWCLLRMPEKGLGRPDVVVVSSLSLLTVFNGFLWRWRYGCRLILEVRDIWPLTIVEEGGFGQRNPLVMALALVEWLGYRFADEVVGTMPNLGEHVAQVLGRQRAVHCIPMGITDDDIASSSPGHPSFEPLPPAYVSEHIRSRIPQGRFVVCHAGSIGITNALDVFFECAAGFAPEDGVSFLIVGDGDLRQSYQQRYGHLPHVVFAPKVPKSQVQALLRQCDLVYFSVHNSKVWRYGQSLNKVIDYMLSGKPVLASYSGYPSMINEANCGRFVAAGDPMALRQAVMDLKAMPAEERESMGQRGQSWLLANRRYATLARHYEAVLLGSR